MKKIYQKFIKSEGDNMLDNLLSYSAIIAFNKKGQKKILSFIKKDQADAERKIADAILYYENIYSGKNIKIVVEDDSMFNEQYFKHNHVKEWGDIKNFLGRISYEDKLYEKLIQDLKKQDVSSLIIDDLRKDWEVDNNEKDFIALVKEQFKQADQKTIFKALDLAKKVHSQIERKHENHPGVPYYNHCIRVAYMAIQANLPSDFVSAALLHDLIEDTDVTKEQLKNDFSDEIINNVLLLTKDGDRATYLRSFKKMNDDIKAVKCFDRLHNLLRAFTFKKPKYWKRYIEETQKYFLDEFMENPKISEEIAFKLDLYLEELKRLLNKMD